MRERERKRSGEGELKLKLQNFNTLKDSRLVVLGPFGIWTYLTASPCHAYFI